MKILVRLPNWLGDMVMSVGFVRSIHHFFPGAEISVIAKRGIHDLLSFFPVTYHQFIFSKQEYKGVSGLYRFGRNIAKTERFDLFFCLPNSFSSATMGWATGAERRIGYKNELRQIFLTNSYRRPKNVHRVQEYVHLLELFTGKKAPQPEVILENFFSKKEYVVVNINSEASSRRLPFPKAISLLTELQQKIPMQIVMIGGPSEKDFVDQVISNLPAGNQIVNKAGQTSLSDLIEIIGSARVMLSTDSGPAHVANALGTPVVILFGAGNENHTAPFNNDNRKIIRLGELSCEPCEKNVCVRFGTPQCLERLSNQLIINSISESLHL
jgi:heptosyltransferase II